MRNRNVTQSTISLAVSSILFQTLIKVQQKCLGMIPIHSLLANCATIKYQYHVVIHFNIILTSASHISTLPKSLAFMLVIILDFLP